jgi:hypothetical protein
MTQKNYLFFNPKIVLFGDTKPIKTKGELSIDQNYTYKFNLLNLK